MLDVKSSLIKSEMSKPWLIQRLQKPHKKRNPFSFGGGLENGGLSEKTAKIINGVFWFDYMGSAEFEFGIVPKVMQFIASQVEKKVVVSGKHSGIYYICPEPYEIGVHAIIDQLLANERVLNLKGYCGLKEAVDFQSEDNNRNIAGWLELDNGFFMFVDKEMFEGTKRLFGIS